MSLKEPCNARVGLGCGLHCGGIGINRNTYNVLAIFDTIYGTNLPRGSLT